MTEEHNTWGKIEGKEDSHRNSDYKLEALMAGGESMVV